MPLSRRTFNQSILHAPVAAILVGVTHAAYGKGILAVRVWPSKDYTRLTIESDVPLTTRQVFVSEPPRLALDIVGIDLNSALRELVASILPDDPYIQGVRVAQNASNVVRLVLDLKQTVRPQVFTLDPVPAAYQYRLVVDLYPSVAIDPLDVLIASLKALPTPSEAGDPLGDLIAAKSKPSVDSSLVLKPSPRIVASVKSASSAASAASPAPSSTRPSATLPQGDASATAPKKHRLIVIAIDPGHGGEDPGAVGPAGTKEKDVVLQIAKLLAQRINDTPLHGSVMRAYLTRDADFFVPLQDRVSKAQRVGADLFISIHADAFFAPTARGASVFALSTKGASSAAAKWMADKENKADAVGGLNIKAKDVQVKHAILDMSTTAQIKDSLNVGAGLLGEIGAMAKLHKGQVEQAGFAVLKAPDIPSILVETAFISHPEEELLLKDPAYQARLADALLRGITRYFAKHPAPAKPSKLGAAGG